MRNFDSYFFSYLVRTYPPKLYTIKSRATYIKVEIDFTPFDLRVLEGKGWSLQTPSFLHRHVFRTLSRSTVLHSALYKRGNFFH